MANTEGLTDEEMLQSVNETVRGWSALSTPTSRVIERLEMGEQGRPAAKVIRISSARKMDTPAGKAYVARPPEEEDGSRTNRDKLATAAPSSAAQQRPILGNIVERKRGKRRNNSTVARPTTHTQPSTQGFPSLKKPIGTFTPTPKSTSVSATTTLTQTVEPTRSDVQDLKRTSAADADRMLASMSAEDIAASKRELRSLLSSDALAFLRNRHNKGKTSSRYGAQKSHQAQPDVSTEDPRKKSINPAQKERLEKERMAHLLSSVKTHEEMDAIYQAETGENSEFVNKEDGLTDPFQVACDLLRSTAPRQNLWAVRTVRDRLTKDYNEGKVVRLPTNQHNWPYPTLLPVSLRCLMDQAPNRVNRFALHTYALESIYLLLRIRCAEEHDIDLTNVTYKDPTAVYQLVFGADAVPTPSVRMIYNSSTFTVSPLSVGQHENVAYATASSSTTATKDGQKFAQDPLWTLLSQMRIIPRLASLFQGFLFTQSLDGVLNVPNEAWLASLGILSMVAQRSPGAATALVQHATLLKHVAHIAWGEGDIIPCIALSVMRLWTILARQSRIAAAGLELPPWGIFLGVRYSDDTGRRLQRWTVVFWRTLLSYGLAIQELGDILTLSASDSTLLTMKSPRAADFLFCWSLILQLHHERVMRAGDKVIREREMRLLVKVRSWMNSCYRQCSEYLARVLEIGWTSDSLTLTSACVGICRDYIVTADDVVPNPPGEFKSDECTDDDEIACIEMLQQLVDAGALSSALAHVAPTFFQGEGSSSKVDEAAAVRFLVELASTLRMLQNRVNNHSSGNTCQVAWKTLCNTLSEVLVGALTAEAARATDKSGSPAPLAVLGWRNRGRFVFIELLRLTSTQKKVSPVICVALAVSALVSMQVGDEALVERLLHLEVVNLPMELRSTVLSQLRASSQKLLQMQHSAALNRSFVHDPSISIDLQSLRSEADRVVQTKQDSEKNVLPLGLYWVWNILAGSSSTETPIERIVEVLTSALLVLHELETGSEKEACLYAESLADGAKMYYLMNVCMQSEEVLANKRIGELFDLLRRRYTRNVNLEFVESFGEACLRHASTNLLDRPPKEEGENENGTSERQKKLAEALLEERKDPAEVLTGKRLQVVRAFVSDLCTGFCQYGGQYAFFGAGLGVFLLPCFPAEIKSEVLFQLQGLLHLLTSPDEDKDPPQVSRILAKPRDS